MSHLSKFIEGCAQESRLKRFANEHPDLAKDLRHFVQAKLDKDPMVTRVSYAKLYRDYLVPAGFPWGEQHMNRLVADIKEELQRDS